MCVYTHIKHSYSKNNKAYLCIYRRKITNLIETHMSDNWQIIYRKDNSKQINSNR